jgi:hypothetical protein
LGSYFSLVPLQALASLAITGQALFASKPQIAVVFFIDSTGNGVQYSLTFGLAERRRWQNVLVKVKLFYFSIFFEFLCTLVRIPDLQQSSQTTPVRPLASRAAPSVLVPPEVDQTPTLAEGKTVVASSKPDRPGIVQKHCEDGSFVIGWEGEERKRARRYNPANLYVVPVLGNVEHPTSADDPVLIIGGTKPELVGQQGIVINCEPGLSSVRVLPDEQVVRIATKYLKLLGARKEVTVPAFTEAVKIPRAEYASVFGEYTSSKGVQLTGRYSFSNFLAGAEAKQAEKAAAEALVSARPQRGKPI